jgi:hypothetical protein
MVKVGDRVRFLNAIGGGVVSKIINREMVMVTDEDGFDVPTLVRECVVVETDTTIHTQEKKKEKEIETLDDFIEKETNDTSTYKPQEETPEGEVLNVMLAFLPQNEKMLSSTNFDAYLINDSNYYLAYNVASLIGTKFVSKTVGFIQPNTKILLQEVERTDLNDWEQLRVQIMALKQKRAYTLKPVYDVQLKLNAVKFYKLHSFVENDYFDEQALLCPVVENDLPYSLGVTEDDIDRILRQKETVFPAKMSMKGKTPDLIVKDLHANELIDNTHGLSANDIFQYQLDTFNQIMQENIKKKGQKIVFIHGKGNGVLRKELLKQLKTKYPTCYVQDASFQEYGYGASMVTIR